MDKKIHISKTDLSDFHKDAFGFRPRGIYQEWWTEDELEAEYQYLSNVCEENRIMEEAKHHQALLDFNKLIEETISYGASDRKTAIRWLLQGEEIDVNWSQDVEHFFWNHGLSWEKINEFKKLV
jgi:urocanate hydratase